MSCGYIPASRECKIETDISVFAIREEGECRGFKAGVEILKSFHIYYPIQDFDFESMTGMKLYKCDNCKNVISIK